MQYTRTYGIQNAKNQRQYIRDLQNQIDSLIVLQKYWTDEQIKLYSILNKKN